MFCFRIPPRCRPRHGYSGMRRRTEPEHAWALCAVAALVLLLLLMPAWCLFLLLGAALGALAYAICRR